MNLNLLTTTYSTSGLVWCALLVVTLLLISVCAMHLFSSRAAAREAFSSGSDAPTVCNIADPATNPLVTGAKFHVQTADAAPYSGDAAHVYTMERANDFDPFTALQREYWSGRQCEMALGQQAIAESSVERDYADFIPRIVGAAGRARLFLLWGSAPTLAAASKARSLRAHLCLVYVYIERGEPRSDRLLLVADTRAGVGSGDRTAIDLALPPPRIMFRPVSVTLCFESDTPGAAPVVLQSIALQIGDGVHFCSVSPACGMGFLPVTATDQLQRAPQHAYVDMCRSVPSRTHWKVNLVGPREPQVAFLQTKWFCVDILLRMRRSVPTQLPSSDQLVNAEPALLPPFRPSAYISTQAGTVSQFTATAPVEELVPGWVKTHYSSAPENSEGSPSSTGFERQPVQVLPALPAPPGVRVRMRIAFATVLDPATLAKDGSNERLDAKTVTVCSHYGASLTDG